KILIVADRNLPDTGHEAEAVQRAASVEMHSGGIHHLLSTPLGPQIANGLDRTHAQPAVQASMDALAPRGEEIARPAIETHAIDEIGRAACGLEIMLPAWIIGVAYAAVAIAIVDAVLTPDLPLAHMDPLVIGEQPLILGVHEAGHQGLRAIAAAH